MGGAKGMGAGRAGRGGADRGWKGQKKCMLGRDDDDVGLNVHTDVGLTLLGTNSKKSTFF